METSALIAKIFGLCYAFLGLGLLINGSYYKKVFEDMMKSHVTMFWGGVMSLVGGVLIVNAHNFWVLDWTVVITFFGWAALLKGASLLVMPKALIKMSKPMLGKTKLLGICTLIFGSALLYCAFFL